jgi:uncharacterized protein (DUF1684 family)
VNPLAELWDWRRRIGDLYATIRAAADPAAAWLHWREVRENLFRTHPQSPLDPAGRAAFAGLRCFPYDPALRFLVRLDAIADAADDEAVAGEDGIVHMRPFARTDGLRASLGGELTLYWIIGYGGGAFLPFADASNGRDTYHAGRYLLDTIKGADLGSDAGGRVVLDFNFSYPPSCAYSPRWVCPLPPAANRLPRAVTAGERSVSA